MSEVPFTAQEVELGRLFAEVGSSIDEQLDKARRPSQADLEAAGQLGLFGGRSKRATVRHHARRVPSGRLVIVPQHLRRVPAQSVAQVDAELPPEPPPEVNLDEPPDLWAGPGNHNQPSSAVDEWVRNWIARKAPNPTVAAAARVHLGPALVARYEQAAGVRPIGWGHNKIALPDDADLLAQAYEPWMDLPDTEEEFQAYVAHYAPGATVEAERASYGGGWSGRLLLDGSAIAYADATAKKRLWRPLAQNMRNWIIFTRGRADAEQMPRLQFPSRFPSFYTRRAYQLEVSARESARFKADHDAWQAKLDEIDQDHYRLALEASEALVGQELRTIRDLRRALPEGWSASRYDHGDGGALYMIEKEGRHTPHRFEARTYRRPKDDRYATHPDAGPAVEALSQFADGRAFAFSLEDEGRRHAEYARGARVQGFHAPREPAEHDYRMDTSRVPLPDELDAEIVQAGFERWARGLGLEVEGGAREAVLAASPRHAPIVVPGLGVMSKALAVSAKQLRSALTGIE